MMKIAIIGATGNAGSALVKEALKRGHEVVGFVRHPERATEIFDQEVQVKAKDAFALTRSELSAFDVVIDAFSSPEGKGYLNIDLATHLIAELRETSSPKIVFITGASSLKHPDGGFLYDHLKQIPGHEKWIDVPESQFYELEFLRHVSNVNWIAFSPSSVFQNGPATGYVRGDDQTLLFDENKQSILNSGNLALAILDELENPRITNTRFTARNQ